MRIIPAWLTGGNDRQLATTQYAGRESASDTAAAKRQAKQRKQRAKSVTAAARAGQAWEDQDRLRERYRR
ncbi:hypothetical protein RVR_4438 [Actinacidiphila reveromycinica]|uniref:Uncharacterized protein n=1 Tax=Actinacidiphila reveromycinica TaxID=659352 RepID=A0A7U3UT76_9ACTN|nr:hypothetical protein [Streptomyces sp. SN-593]BBA98305.1 hypothetical protein RVR_4438 [Streptomyces sp. SN-593]